MKKLMLLLVLVSFCAAPTSSRAFEKKENQKKNANFIPKRKSIIPFWMKNAKMCSGRKFESKKVVAPMLWSNPITWLSFGATKPVNGSAVIIPAGVHIILDENPPTLANLIIEGVLEFGRMNLTLTSDWIVVMGKLEIGTTNQPFTQQAVLTLKGSNVAESVMNMGTRGLMVMGGFLELHGTPPTIPWTKINAHGLQNATSINLMQNVNWNTNDQIVIAPTDYYQAGLTNNAVSQRTSITSISSNTLNLSEGLNSNRWGLLQYATTNGMSLINTNPVASPSSVGTTPKILDERAEVGNLTRNIIIQSPDDLLWQNQGFGCHIMIMRNGLTQGVAHIDGIEIRRGGQTGIIGRYPFHWHMLSYEGTTTLPDATGQYINNSSVNQSSQRGIVIHGTNGVLVSKNVIYDVKGHAVFTEDASERRNTIDGNLVLHVRNPSNALKIHESDNSTRGSSGFWISNPDNTIINNTAADCRANGFWFAFTTQAWGLSAGIPLNPSRTLFGVFDNNTSHSNNDEGIMMDLVEEDNLGNTTGLKYKSTTDGLDPEWPFPNLRRYNLTKYTTYKNGGGGIWNRAVWPNNFENISADNQSSFFAGAGDEGLIERCLVIGTSLNHLMNSTDRSNNSGTNPTPVAMASYHSAFDIKNNIIINFPAVAGINSGAFATNDYYLRPVDKGLARNVGNVLIQSHPGVRTVATEPQFVLAGALWDPFDYWGGSPMQDNYYVYDTPFFTTGLTKTIVAPSTAVSGGVIVEGPFFGFLDFSINNCCNNFMPLMALDVKRVTSNFATIGTWTVGEGQVGQLLPNMRHFATHPTGLYDLSFPTINEVTEVVLRIENMTNTTDYQVVAIEYSGNFDISAVLTSVAYNFASFNTPITPTDETHVYSAVTNLQAVINSPLGETFWHDKLNNKVWLKIKGGLNQNPNTDLSPFDDANLYRSFGLRVFGTPSLLSNPDTYSNTLIKIYPNPSTGILNITNSTNFNYNVVDILGRLVKKGIIKNETLDISELNNGNYILQIENESQKNVFKIIKI